MNCDPRWPNVESVAGADIAIHSLRVVLGSIRMCQGSALVATNSSSWGLVLRA